MVRIIFQREGIRCFIHREGKHKTAINVDSFPVLQWRMQVFVMLGILQYFFNFLLNNLELLEVPFSQLAENLVELRLDEKSIHAIAFCNEPGNRQESQSLSACPS